MQQPEGALLCLFKSNARRKTPNGTWKGGRGGAPKHSHCTCAWYRLQELRLISAKREVFTPPHRAILPHDVIALEEILIEANSPDHPTHRTPHDIAVIEAAEAARRAR